MPHHFMATYVQLYLSKSCESTKMELPKQTFLLRSAAAAAAAAGASSHWCFDFISRRLWVDDTGLSCQSNWTITQVDWLLLAFVRILYLYFWQTRFLNTFSSLVLDKQYVYKRVGISDFNILAYLLSQVPQAVPVEKNSSMHLCYWPYEYFRPEGLPLNKSLMEHEETIYILHIYTPPTVIQPS